MLKNFHRLAVVVALVGIVVTGWNSAASADTIDWNLGGGGNWDFVSTNWTADGGGRYDNLYANGDAVTFGNTAGGTINIVSNVAPLSTTVNAASGTYTFSGANITAGTLAKSGGSTLILNSQYTVGSNISLTGGTIQLGASNRLANNS